jgi:Flp pilus assembly protein TadD
MRHLKIPLRAIPPGRIFLLLSVCLVCFSCGPLLAQNRNSGPGPVLGAPSTSQANPVSVTLIINLRDSEGTPLDVPGVVNLQSNAQGFRRTATTRDASAAVFDGVTQGEYDAEAIGTGYQTTWEHISVNGFGSTVQVYIFLPRQSETKPAARKPGGPVMAPRLRAEVDKGLEAMSRRQFELARTHFAKAAAMAPGNPDVVYLLGAAEQALNHPDLARQNFEKALSLDPGHERSLLALGELELRAGETHAAITTLEKAYRDNGAGWRGQFLLATAYAKAGRFAEAETRAEHAVSLAREKGAEPLLLLGKIQAAQRKFQEARHTWEKLATDFPNATAAQNAKQYLAALSEGQPDNPLELTAANLPLPPLPSIDLAPPAQRPWAPLDVDSVEFPLARNAACETEQVLNSAAARVRSQLQNFEKFTATEHIEHQEIDRYGQPGPVRSRDFSYIVFVSQYKEESFFLDEQRDTREKDDTFPTSLATIGLNNLGVAILQPTSRKGMIFRCEGLASIRERAAWQIHFEEKPGATSPLRVWRRNDKLFTVPVKGRMWVSAASFDVLRVETDLREPVTALQLTRDHLRVDYGPVKFRSEDTTLWLPWSAEMYMELRGHRYHHKHYLSDYLLFEVDTNHKVGQPQNATRADITSSPFLEADRMRRFLASLP